jgi:MFS superfamily sulfate permease-like transporter
MLTDWIPLLRDLRQYRREWLSHDLIAGLSVAAVQVPTAIAYANLAGFPPEIGLYASMLPVLVYALFGSSRQLIIGPDAATCAMVAALLLPLAQGNLAYYLQLSAALAIMAGLLMVIGGMTRMGFIVNFFARPILIGFLNGVAISIIAGQLGKLDWSSSRSPAAC